MLPEAAPRESQRAPGVYNILELSCERGWGQQGAWLNPPGGRVGGQCFTEAVFEPDLQSSKGIAGF